MIEFCCKNCGQRFRLRQSDAGKKGRCPKCKNVLIVPKLENSSCAPEQGVSKDKQQGSKYSAYDLSLLDFPDVGETHERPVDKSGQDSEQIAKIAEESDGCKEFAAERKLPWFIDILLYPTSQPGLITIGIIFLLKLLTDIAAIVLLCCFCGGILGLIVRIVISYSYMYWYFSECIRDSAAGGIRAPETIGSITGIGAMFLEFFRLFACYAFFLGPVTFYRGYTFLFEIEMNSTIFWGLLTYGIFFFPMGALAVVMFDSVNGLNPILIVRSIITTFIQYCGLFILFYGLSILFIILLVMIGSILPRRGMFSHYFLSYILSNIAFIYSLLIYGHLLGRFYWRYQEKLYWEV
jgi:hypothetical protein